MRALLLGFFLLGRLTLPAQENAVQNFAGSAPLTTPSFTTSDNWEIRWDAPGEMNFTILSPSGTVLAGISGQAKGSLYLPKGATVYLRINVTTDKLTPWHLAVVQLGPSPAGDGSVASLNNIPPPGVPPPVATPVPSAAPPAATPTPSPTPMPPPALDFSRSVVVIKGDDGEGSGFLIKTPDGPAVVTNLHVLYANPNFKIYTTSGEQVAGTGLKGAADRDLALIAIKDNHYNYLETNSDISNSVHPGDAVVTPGNSEGGEVVLNTPGTVLGLGPERIEISNPIYHGNSGGPVIHTASDKVIAVVTGATRVVPTDDLDQASHDNKDSAIAGSMRYFALRLDTVPTWENYDWNRYLNETTFLKEFHHQSRCLDSYMNGRLYERNRLTQTDPEEGRPNARYYLQNDKIRSANDRYHQMADSGDNAQRLEALRELTDDLDSIADTDMTVIQGAGNFYSYDQILAKEEIAYRKGLEAEIDKVGDKISDQGH